MSQETTSTRSGRRLVWIVVAIALVAASAAAAYRAATDTSPDGPSTTIVVPSPGSRHASPETTISVVGAGVDDATVTVTGSTSGTHTGDLRDHSAQVGLTFDPHESFEPGEQVTVTVTGGATGSFTVADMASFDELPAPEPEVQDEDDPDDAPVASEESPLVSRPDLRAPTVTVTTPRATATDEYYFATPRASDDNDAGAMIFDEQGELVWFRPVVGDGDLIGDLKVAQMDGEPVLTWFVGRAPMGGGHYRGHWVVVDDSYAEVARVDAGNGFRADIHDIQFTDRGTAWLVIYSPVHVDLSEIDGPAEAVVLDSIVQEVDLATNDVLFEWHSLDHVPVADTFEELDGTVVDYAHVNSVEESPDGNIVVSLRNVSQVIKVDRSDGSPMWVLGGRAGTLDTDDDGPSYQHDARELVADRVTIFDNGNQRDPEYSRALVYDIDVATGTATTVAEHRNTPDDSYGPTQGSAQPVTDGVLVTWGGLGTLTEFVDGEEVLELELDSGGSYRVARAAWTGDPTTPPDIALDADGSAVHLSWNGATEVASWRVLTGPTAEDLQELTTVPRDGFETAIALRQPQALLAAEALDAAGEVLGSSNVIRTGQG